MVTRAVGGTTTSADPSWQAALVEASGKQTILSGAGKAEQVQDSGVEDEHPPSESHPWSPPSSHPSKMGRPNLSRRLQSKP
jgi:predicted FMN-binding regulatory protein PaiB